MPAKENEGDNKNGAQVLFFLKLLVSNEREVKADLQSAALP
jgi:hypothetical protein